MLAYNNTEVTATLQRHFRPASAPEHAENSPSPAKTTHHHPRNPPLRARNQAHEPPPTERHNPYNASANGYEGGRINLDGSYQINSMVMSMETNPEKIVDNLLKDMREVDDWICIADATAANEKDAFDATYEDVVTILEAVKESPSVTIGKVARRFIDLPDNWSPSDVAKTIFSSENTIVAMMDFWLRSTAGVYS